MVDFSYVEPSDPWLARCFVRTVETLTGRGRLLDLYRNHDPARDFFDSAVRALVLDLGVGHAEVARIPREGPLVVVANHPFGVVDGLALTALVGRRRDDLRIVANGLLTRAPEAATRIFPIDFAATPEAIKTNLKTRKDAAQWLNQGGSILIFPAGAISTAQGWFGPVCDERWKPFAAKLIHQSKADVLPIFTRGRNSLLFQAASLLHPTARAATLLNEVRNKIGMKMDIRIGQPIPYRDLEGFRDRQALVDRLHDHVHALAGTPIPWPDLRDAEPVPVMG